MPFKDSDGHIIGHLAVLDSKPIPNEARYMALFEIFGNRASAEMRRIRAEEELRRREEQLRRLIDSALDAIIDFDDDLRIHLTNPSATQLFNCDNADDRPASMHDWFTDESIEVMREVMAEF